MKNSSNQILLKIDNFFDSFYPFALRLENLKIKENNLIKKIRLDLMDSNKRFDELMRVTLIF